MKLVLSFITILFFVTSCSPTGGGGESSGSAITSFLPFILIFVLFYYLILRPQQKQNRQRQQMLNDVKRGDKVLTSGGIYGKIINVNENELTVEIAKGINVQMARSGVSAVVNTEKEVSKPKGSN